MFKEIWNKIFPQVFVSEPKYSLNHTHQAPIQIHRAVQMTIRDRWAVIRAIELVTAHFGVGHKVKVKIMPIEKECYAQYHSGEKCIQINSNMCNSVALMVSSLFHEFTHVKQFARNEVPLHERYEPKEFRSYYFQFIELEARKYQIMLARQFVRLYANEIGSEFVKELENIEYMMQQQHYLMTQ